MCILGVMIGMFSRVGERVTARARAHMQLLFAFVSFYFILDIFCGHKAARVSVAGLFRANLWSKMLPNW